MKLKFITSILLSMSLTTACMAQQEYPYPVQYVNINIEQQDVKMAYMDVKPAQPNGKTVMLFHGKNFNGYYWKDVASFLSSKGYRVVIPDQVGWGKSDKPQIHYSFHQLANNSKILLDSLHIRKVMIVGHSMGGMLATRFSLMYPALVQKLVLEDPIGLEDYRTFVPYTPVAAQYKNEQSATFESYKKYMQGYFPEWKPEYDELVKQQAASLGTPEFDKIAWVNALTYEMIYEQPVCYEFKNLKPKTLLIIGNSDRTIVGKDKLTSETIKQHGLYQTLGKEVSAAIPGSKLVELQGVGHIPHVQSLQQFENTLLPFLAD